MNQISNIKLGEHNSRAILADIVTPENLGDCINLVIFCHGFKGFKDWGAWQMVAKEFAKQGFTFLKFNFSHNGVGPEDLLNFTSLEAFGRNSYIKEVIDLETVLSYVFNELSGLLQCKGVKSCHLIGHSRGGGIAMVKATEDSRITSLSTWASIANFNRFGSSEELAVWQKEGVKYILNGRTGQQMPQYYELYESYIANKDRLDVEQASRNLNKKVLVIHGKNDKAVGLSHAKRISQWSPKAQLLEIDNADHVFNTSHPFTRKKLPEEMNRVVQETIAFFKNQV